MNFREEMQQAFIEPVDESADKITANSGEAWGTDFGAALSGLRAGRRVRRADWLRAGDQWLALQVPDFNIYAQSGKSNPVFWEAAHDWQVLPE